LANGFSLSGIPNFPLPNIDEYIKGINVALALYIAFDRLLDKWKKHIAQT
jgi:hypothetical protein